MDNTKPKLLPQYPKVEVDQGTIVIIDENDHRIVWGEEDPERAMEIAQEIEEGLQSLAHVKYRLIETFEELAQELSDAEVPRETRAEYIWEAYWDIHRKLPQLLERLLTE